MKTASPFGARRRSRRQPQSRGFTLLEVLVTLAVVAITLAAIARLANGAMRSQMRLTDRLSALALAEGWLADRRVEPSSGVAGDGLRWSVAAADLVDAASPPTSAWRPERVQLEVMDAHGGRWTIETVRLMRSAAR